MADEHHLCGESFPLAKTTRDRYLSVYKNYLQPAFGELCLRDITQLTVQCYISGMADSKLSQKSKDKVRDVLSSILGSAVRYGLLVKNPAEGVRLPVPKSGRRTKPYVTQQQFSISVDLIAEPYATMLYTAAYTGLRPSEVIAPIRTHMVPTKPA